MNVDIVFHSLGLPRNLRSEAIRFMSVCPLSRLPRSRVIRYLYVACRLMILTSLVIYELPASSTGSSAGAGAEGERPDRLASARLGARAQVGGSPHHDTPPGALLGSAEVWALELK